MTTLTWIGIAFCISQSALFSGLNLAFFGVSRLRLEIEAHDGSRAASRVLAMRSDSNFLLTTILWGNVAINSLLTLLSKSLLTGLGAFLFSTVVITFLGEIVPQAYFSRHALRMASLLSPVLRLYQLFLFPVAKPSAMMLDMWLGREGPHFFREREVRQLLERHRLEDDVEIGHVEARGAMNFLLMDDLSVAEEGEEIDLESIVEIPFVADQGADRPSRPVFPAFEQLASDPFLRQVERSGHKWVVLVDERHWPMLVLDCDGFLRAALFGPGKFDPARFCHRPIIITDPTVLLDACLPAFRVDGEHQEDDVIDRDMILVWSDDHRRVITGADLLGRLLRGIAQVSQGSRESGSKSSTKSPAQPVSQPSSRTSPVSTALAPGVDSVGNR